jgi:hypothetical protein
MNNGDQLDSLLKRMAEDHRPDLPSPGLIWWRAQVLKKYEQKRRIERPIRIMRVAAMAMCFVVLAALAAANRQQFQALLGSSGWLFTSFAVAVVTASLVSAAFLWPAAKRR